MHHANIHAHVHHRHPWVGGLLIGTSAVSLFAMLHHPVAHGGGGASQAQALARIANLASLVHGVLVLLLVAGCMLLAEFAALRVRRVALVRAGRQAYLMGTIALAGAALVNGFAVPALVTSAAADAVGIDAALALAWQLNQALAGAGSIALAAGIGIWSVDLARGHGPGRYVGYYGVLMAAGLSLALGGGWLSLDVRGMLLTLVLLAVWQVAAGVLLLRGAPASPETSANSG